jgi:hypothetical protein
MREESTGEQISVENRRKLRAVRGDLLRLHKILLDSERASYEGIHGRVASSGEMLRLVLDDEWFAWLRVLSQLVVQIDEKFADKKEPMTESDAGALLSQSRLLLRSPETDESFGKKYQAVIVRDSEVFLAHTALLKLLAEDS